MPLQETSGAASYDAFGGGAPSEGPLYVENVFSTWLYTGTGAAQSIVNGINLAGKGGFVWLKNRTAVASPAFQNNQRAYDTVRGPLQSLQPNLSDAQGQFNNSLTSFNANGFSVGTSHSISGTDYVTWTFREQPRFFDAVAYTGNGIAGRTVAHNLGSVPGFFMVKRLDESGDWRVYHRSLGANAFTFLNANLGAFTDSDIWNNTAPTSTEFTLGNQNSQNIAGAPYIAYLFAHNAGGFGLNGTDNIISCGSYTGLGSTFTVTLGYEPQWLLVKRSTGGSNNWVLMDNMRGMSLTTSMWLFPNTSDAETNAGVQCNPTSTGFTITSTGTNLNDPGATYIYVAIRRGPMATPTTGTSVFAPSTGIEPQSSALFTAGFADLALHSPRLNESGNGHLFTDRLRGNGNILQSNLNGSELNQSSFPYTRFDSNAGAYIPAQGYYNNAGGGTNPYVIYAFRRAPGFFDEVCYTGNGVARTLNHNLGVAPELMIVKCRSGTSDWRTYQAPLDTPSRTLRLDSSAAAVTDASVWDGTAPTSTVFYVGTSTRSNGSGDTYVNYLFASCPGVSRVGSYTGTGSTQTVNCGFTGGARFVLIKRTDAVGDWLLWDTARGMTPGNDFRSVINNAGVQINDNWVYTVATGFQIVVSESSINASGGNYIFLAIA